MRKGHRERRIPSVVALTAIMATTLGGRTAVSVAASDVSPGTATLLACQKTIADASLKLGSEVQRRVSRCITRALPCLLEPTKDGCCASAASRCDDDLRAIAAAERRFERLVTTRACDRAPLPQVLGSGGLGLGGIAGACGCLVPAVEVSDVRSLSVCLRRLVVEDLEHVLAFQQPRLRDAVTCMGMASQFTGAFREPPATCATCPAPSPSSNGGTSTPAGGLTCHEGDQVTITVGIAFDDVEFPDVAGVTTTLARPQNLDVPGTGSRTDQSRASNLTGKAGFFGVSDQDLDFDGVDDHVAIGLVTQQLIPPGDLATVRFDCAPGTPAPTAADFPCAADLATSAGTDVRGASCSVTSVIGP